MNLRDILDSEILPSVEKPSRYIGSEVNVVAKPADEVDVRIVLAFPDLYDIGLGNLGLHILYDIVNKLPWAAAERAYAPALDMEQQLRQRGLNTFALESKDTLDVFDGIGFTLQSELTYTNILNLIELSGIPLRTQDRDDTHALTFAGGPAVFNPEPIAPFMDFFVIGDGEDIIVEIVQVLREQRGAPRAQKLAALAALEGVYVPALYPFDVLENGQVVPKLDHPKIRRRLTRSLESATFPVNYIVPYTQQVHDRVSLEVLRGCTQGCRFCQAGMVTRPVRERTVETVTDLMKQALDKTGYEEVSLVSLSTCDHSQVRRLVDSTAAEAAERRVAVSLPSLRLDSYSVELSERVAGARRTGITFAPEAASPRMRAVINKWIGDDELLTMSADVFARGWTHVKLYFMIGLPTERDEDIEAIGDLCYRTLAVGRTKNHAARVNLGVSTFVPKPFTPFQWAAQIGLDETFRRQRGLGDILRRERNIKFGRHDPRETFLEGLVTRADRRAADLIEAAFRLGARFDAWGEHLRWDAWKQAIDEVNYDCDDALREREVGERFPWDHIDVLVSPEWLAEDWARAKRLEHAPDCRRKKCHQCGVIESERELCKSMLQSHIRARNASDALVRADEAARALLAEAPVVHDEPTDEPLTDKPIDANPAPTPSDPPTQHLWVRIARVGPVRWLSHLETNSAMLRALRRAKAPLAYSQGFHPHPKIAFSTAVPVGEASLGEYMEVQLERSVVPAELLAALRATLPEGFDALDIGEAPPKAPALMALNQGSTYAIELVDDDLDAVDARVKALLEAPAILVERKGKTRTPTADKRSGKGRGFTPRTPVMRAVDIRPMIRDLVRVDGGRTLLLSLMSVDGRPGKPKEILPMLTDAPSLARVQKVDTLDANGRSIADGMVRS